jgi:hypothetical protein
MGNHRRVRDAQMRRQSGGTGFAGGMRLAEAEQQTQQQGAFAEGDGHGRNPFAMVVEALL